MALQVDYRPQTLSELFGNEHIKDSLGEVLKRKNPPRSFLFTGVPGTGKTTLARIIKNIFKISNTNFYEYNAANTRGIDTIREITDNAQYLGIGDNTKKLYLMDECFAPHTMVFTTKGERPISKIKVGDFVFNKIGEGKVTNVFNNFVYLDRVCKISLSNGSNLFCSSDHLFFTESGWVRACDLVGHLTYSVIGDTMYSIMSPRREKPNAKIRFLQRDRRKNLPNLFRSFFSWEKFTRALEEKNLFKKLWGKTKKQKPRIYEEITQRKKPQKIKSNLETEIQEKHTRRFVTENNVIGKNENKKPSKEPQNSRKNEKYKKNERDIKHLCWRSWRKWATNTCSKIISNFSWLGNRSCYWFRGQVCWLPNQLQSGYWQPNIEDCNRSRWKWSQMFENKSNRYEENQKITRVRVESVEIYQQGSNDQSFRGVIEDHERNQGYVVFHDLEIDTHPSYYAGGVLVHNCHRMTVDAMNALLKLLEEPPAHCYFVLCTAEIETIKPTIKNAIKRRCHEYELSPLKANETVQLLKTILRKEGIEPTERLSVIKKIATSCEGRPGVALKLLDQVKEITNEDKATKIIEKAVVTESTVIELCRLLNSTGTSNDAKWPKLQKMIKDLKEGNDAESVRYAVLGYFNAVLLSNGWSMRCAKLITYFSDSFMYSGWAAFTAACFFINFGENGDDVAH